MIESALGFPLSEEPILLRELNHRINNEFSSIISIVALAAARSGSEEVKAALTEVSKLLHEHVDVHRALEMPQHDTFINAAAYLRKLCTSISRSKLDRLNINLVLAASPVHLQPDHCWRLGMIVYELITNAARHAFTDSGGKVRVELLCAGAFVECRVLDNGSAPSTMRPGRGLKLVRELAKTLAGGVEHEFGADGSRATLVFPWCCEPQRSSQERAPLQMGAAVEISVPKQEM